MLRVKAQHEELVGKHDWQLVTSDLSRDAAKILRVSEGLAREKLLRFLQNKRYYSKKVRASHHLVFGGNRSKVNPNQKSKTAQSESPEKDSKRDEPIAPCPEQLSPTLSDSLGLSEEKVNPPILLCFCCIDFFSNALFIRGSDRSDFESSKPRMKATVKRKIS